MLNGSRAAFRHSLVRLSRARGAGSADSAGADGETAVAFELPNARDGDDLTITYLPSVRLDTVPFALAPTAVKGISRGVFQSVGWRCRLVRDLVGLGPKADEVGLFTFPRSISRPGPARWVVDLTR